jgi:hypothetical protein
MKIIDRQIVLSDYLAPFTHLPDVSSESVSILC